MLNSIKAAFGFFSFVLLLLVFGTKVLATDAPSVNVDASGKCDQANTGDNVNESQCGLGNGQSQTSESNGNTLNNTSPSNAESNSGGNTITANPDANSALNALLSTKQGQSLTSDQKNSLVSYFNSNPASASKAISDPSQAIQNDPNIKNILNNGSSSVSTATNGSQQNGQSVVFNNPNNEKTVVTNFNPARLPDSIPGQFGTVFSVQSQTAAASVSCQGTVVLRGFNGSAFFGQNGAQLQWQSPITRGENQEACKNLPVVDSFKAVLQTITPVPVQKASTQTQKQRESQEQFQGLRNEVIINIDGQHKVIRSRG